MSIHTDRAFALAQRKRAAAASSREVWEILMALSKRELAEIAMHLASVCTDEYGDNEAAFARLIEERDILRENGLI